MNFSEECGTFISVAMDAFVATRKNNDFECIGLLETFHTNVTFDADVFVSCCKPHREIFNLTLCYW
jgi:hypothetical protein